MHDHDGHDSPGAGDRFVAVTTVRDEGAAAVVEELLTDAGLAVKLRRIHDPYFGGGAKLEIRVPAGDVARAAQLVGGLLEGLSESPPSYVTAEVKASDDVGVRPSRPAPRTAAERAQGEKIILVIFFSIILALALISFFIVSFFYLFHR